MAEVRTRKEAEALAKDRTPMAAEQGEKHQYVMQIVCGGVTKYFSGWFYDSEDRSEILNDLLNKYGVDCDANTAKLL